MANFKRRVDEQTEVMLYQGASITQLSTIFGMDVREIRTRMRGMVMPCGQRANNEIYSIKEVAPYLVQPAYDMDEFIQRMSTADLPTLLRKEYWAGMRSRQLYEKEAAELWGTQEVIETISEVLKTVRLSMLLSRESISRETELTPRQQQIIERIIDKTLADIHGTVKQKFKERKDKASKKITEQKTKARPVEVSDDEEL